MQTCARCGAECGAAASYCGTCGAHHAEAARELKRQFEQRMEEAERLRQADQYADCEAALRALCNEQDPRLAKLVDKALERAEQVAVEHEQRQQEVAHLYESACKAAAQREYEKAVQLLEQIPGGLRSLEMQSVLAEVRGVCQELHLLRETICSQVRSQRFPDLAFEIDRLLTLTPRDAGMQRLAARLRERYVQHAKRYLAAYDYDQAVVMLNRIPNAVRDDASHRLLHHLRELQWLADDVRNAPVVDPPLLRIAQRLQQVSPQHPEVKRWCERLDDKMTEPPESHSACPIWNADVSRTRLEMPIYWLGCLTNVTLSDQARPIQMQHPGQFMVALGLALQGLGQSRIAAQLAAGYGTGAFGRLMNSLRKTPRSIWGLDLGPSSLKAVKLVTEGEGQVVLEKCCHIGLPFSIEHGDEGARAERLLQQLLAQHPDAAHAAVVNLPGERSFGRYVLVPAVRGRKLHDLIQHETRLQIPLPLEEVLWDFQCLGDVLGLQGQQAVLLLAARRRDVEQRLALFRQHDVQVVALQNDSVALYNAAAHELFPTLRLARDRAVALLDVGSSTTNLVIGSHDMIWFRSIPSGGDAAAQLLMKTFQLTRDQAEQLKRAPHRARRLSQLYEVLDPYMEQLVGETQRTLRSYDNLGFHRPIDHMYALGGGFCLHRMLRHFHVDA